MAEKPLQSPSANRYEGLDVLRGAGIFGIFAMNVQAFAMVTAAYSNPTLAFFDGIDYVIWYLTAFFFNGKFISLFSILFGVGIVILAERVEKAGGSPIHQHFRRMIILGIIGLLHAYLIWWGDILFTYGLVGAIVFLFRKWRPRNLLIIGFVAICMGPLINLGIHATIPFWDEQGIAEFEQFWNPSQEEIQRELEQMRGNWLEQMPRRIENAITMQTWVLFLQVGWHTGGLMLLGVAFWKLRILGPKGPGLPFYIFAGIVFFTGAFIQTYALDFAIEHGWGLETTFIFGALFPFSAVGLSIGYLAAGLWIVHKGYFPTFRWILGIVGRYALSNYLLQSMIASLIFYGTGLGMIGRINRIEQWLTVIVVWGICLLFSRTLDRYQIRGPAETVLRWGQPRTSSTR